MVSFSNLSGNGARICEVVLARFDRYHRAFAFGSIGVKMGRDVQNRFRKEVLRRNPRVGGLEGSCIWNLETKTRRRKITIA